MNLQVGSVDREEQQRMCEDLVDVHPQVAVLWVHPLQRAGIGRQFMGQVMERSEEDAFLCWGQMKSRVFQKKLRASEL